MRHPPPPDKAAAFVLMLAMIGLAFFIAVNFGGGVGLGHLVGGLVVAIVLGLVGLLKRKR